MKSASRLGRGRLMRALGLLAAALLLMLALALAALRLDGVQRALFARGTAVVEARTGLRVAAESVRLRPLRATLQLTRPSVAAGSQEPFFVAEGLTVRVAPLSLLRGPLVLGEVLLLAPRLDGTRALPELPGAAHEKAGPPAITVESLRIQDGAAAGFALPAALRPHLESASIEGLWLEGELVDGRLRLDWEGARVRATPSWRPPLEVVVAGRLAGPTEGPLRLERLVVEGEALEASATGRLGIAPEQPLAVELEIEADAARLLGAETGPAPVRLSGALDLRARRGEGRIEVVGLPAELARPWIGHELFEEAALAGSRLHAEGDIELDGDTFSGLLEGRWTHGEQLLAETAATASAELSAAEIPIDLRLQLLPAAAGDRSLEARLLVPRPAPAEARIDSGRVRLELPDLEAGLATLRRRWPAWVPELPAGLAGGPLRVHGRLFGSLRSPSLRLEGRWLPASGASVKFAGEGALATRRLRSRIAIERLPLARFVDGASGSLDGSATLSFAGGALSGELSVDGDGLGRGELQVDSLRLSAALDGRRVLIRELAARQEGRNLRASGEVDLGESPAAELAVELAGDWGPVAAAAGNLRLEAGRLALDLPRVELSDETASLSATIPLGTLAELPGAEALRELPLEGAGGPLEITWDQPAIDWAAALGAAEPAEGQPAPRWKVGSSGRVSLEPSSAETAVGEVEISVPLVEQDGASISAASPLRLTLAAGRLELAPARIEVAGRQVEVSGEALLRADWSPHQPPGRLIEQARLAARTTAEEPVDALDVALLLGDGGLELTAEALMTDGRRGRLRGAAPLEALTKGTQGGVVLSWQLPPADWSAWLGGNGAEERAVKRLVAGIEGRLELDLDRPALAIGEMRMPDLEVELGERSLKAREPLVLRLAEGRLSVESVRLSADGTPLELGGWLDLEPDWRPGAPLLELVREVALKGGGVLPAALLNPFLGGGAGEGDLLAGIDVSGRRESARGELRLDGAGAGFYFTSPYALEVAEPELTLKVEGGAAAFEGTARLNEGRLRFSGEADSERGVSVRTRLDGVRAVLDHGLLILLDGNLRLRVTPEGEGLLAGTVTVDRGQLTRPIRLESLLLEQLLPADLLGTELDPLEAIALDLRLETRQGVRVKNNLADLKVRWEPIAVRGNLLQPIIEGRLETDPGGLIYAYGQTVRLDSAAVVYRGLPLETPTLELQTTTSSEDPSIDRLAGNDPFGEARVTVEGTEEELEARTVPGGALTTGLGSFLGEQLSGSVGEALGGTRISFRPLLIFGEADPGARLTASRDLSARATLAASVDLRNAERQTYLLDLHDERAAARLSAQLFTNDPGNQGGTLQQRLEFGGFDRRVEGPRLRRLEIDRVPGIRRRALKRAVGHRKGDRLPDGAAFEMAVSLGSLLRDRGYPDARVMVEEGSPPERPGVALAVRIDSGPHVELSFTGAALPKPLRRAVAQLYRGDFYEPTALEEMRAEAVRAWRSRGHLDPRVEVWREVVAAGPPEQRLVTVESEPGKRVDPGPPRFAGLPPPESAEVASLFAGTLRRVELAAGLEAAERRALQGMAALGYSQAKITGRRLSPDGRELTVEVDAGERLRLAVLELVDSRGVSTEVGEAGGIAAGDPVRADILSRAALGVESELRDAGYLDAEVTVRIEPLGPDRAAERKAVFELDRGRLYRHSVTEFEGLGATRASWARRRAGLTEGEPLAPDELRDARRRLYGTGLFSAVGSGVEGLEEDGARVLFEVQEQPRYRLAYGLRWESEEGTSVVVDALDRNFLGRGVDLGLRALWSEELQQLRLSGSIPGVLGPRSSLELFALAGQEERLVDDGAALDELRTLEGTVQLSWQLGRRTTGRVYGRYRDRRFVETFLEEDPFFGPLDPIEVRVKQPFLGLQYIFDDRDDSAAPGRGLFASVDLSYSDETLGGDIRYGRIFAQLNSFRPAGRLAGRRLTWAQSVRLGHAAAFSGQELLGDLLLRAGGEYSVRGYRRESLGPPVLASSFPPSVEDNSLFVLNEELRFEIWDLLSGLVFFDAGNVWIEDDVDLDLFTAAGFGLRASTPFGLFRLDLAWPLDRREEIDPEYKLYFGLGNVF